MLQMPGHEREFMIGMKSGSKEGEARDVVPMGVGEHQGRFGDALFEIPVAQIADAGSGIEDDLLAARIHFQATRIAAEGDVVGRRAGDAAAYTPEFEFKTHEAELLGAAVAGDAGFLAINTPRSRVFTQRLY